jgi:hypothetical protein
MVRLSFAPRIVRGREYGGLGLMDACITRRRTGCKPPYRNRPAHKSPDNIKALCFQGILALRAVPAMPKLTPPKASGTSVREPHQGVARETSVAFHRPRQPGASLAHHPVPHTTKFQPNIAKTAQPAFEMDLSAVLPADGVKEITEAGRMAFHFVGDTGGVKNPEPQKLVARGQEEALRGQQLAPSLRGAAMAPAFCYHLGDVAY